MIYASLSYPENNSFQFFLSKNRESFVVTMLPGLWGNRKMCRQGVEWGWLVGKARRGIALAASIDSSVSPFVFFLVFFLVLFMSRENGDGGILSVLVVGVLTLSGVLPIHFF